TMKQLLLTDRFLPHRGGSRVYYYEICRRLTIPVLTGPEKKSVDFDRDQSFPILRRWGIRPDYAGWFHPKNPLANILLNYLLPLLCMTFWALVAAIRLKPKLIHAGGFQFAGFSALVVKKALGIPYLVYVHGEEVLACRSGKYLSRYMKWVFQHADGLIANSEYTKTLLISIGIDNRGITIVNPGINETFFDRPRNMEVVREAFGLEGKRTILSVGRLTKRKGHIQVLKALPYLISKYPHLHYLIAGTGEESERLKRYIDEKRLTRHVTFAGDVDDAELRALYWSCEVFVLANRMLASDVEGFGMVFLEAGAAGKPVIGGRSGGAVEAVQDGVTGYLVDTEEPREIADGIDKVFRNADTSRSLGRNGRSWARLFLWPRQTAKIAAVVSRSAVRNPPGEMEYPQNVVQNRGKK
ncbi:MAG: glycosyltransferase family 4 protein, partial [Proteobacteria bacterium]|nr:glycosyltransferase family 4 protein [Pseudomonadota bacterium]